MLVNLFFYEFYSVFQNGVELNDLSKSKFSVLVHSETRVVARGERVKGLLVLLSVACAPCIGLV